MRIIMVRHGETDANLKRIVQGHMDTELNDRGEEQAREVSKLIAQREKVDGVYSSSLQRAYRTAEIIAEACEVELFPVAELKERFMGPIEGMLHKDAIAKRKLDKLPSLLCYGEGEKKMASRLIRGFNYCIEDAKARSWETIVLVSHGSALSKLYRQLVVTKTVRFASEGVSERFRKNLKLGNCSVSIIENGQFVAYAEQWTDSIVRERDLV